MIDVSQLEAFAQKLEDASQNLKPTMAQALDEVGEEFLTVVQEEILAAGNVDTRRLLSSFTKGSGAGIYNLDAGSLRLEIGTRIEYAKWVNDGHRQQPGRFIPGVWSGDRFIYQPNSKTGMVLKADFVKGSHFFDKSVEVLGILFPEYMTRAFENYISKYL